jgi:hypothetical protein
VNNIDDASGRVLDALVARHVFRLPVQPTVNTGTRELDAMCRLPSGDWAPVPLYSSMVSGSDKVNEKLQDLGWILTAERRADLMGAPAIRR